MVGSEVKLMEIFKLFLKNTSNKNSKYLFEWIRKCSADASVDKNELTEEVLKSVERLIAWDRSETKEIVVRLPALGPKSIPALE